MWYFHLDTIAANQQHAVKGALNASERGHPYGAKKEKIHQRDSRNIRGQMNSLVHFEKKINSEF